MAVIQLSSRIKHSNSTVSSISGSIPSAGIKSVSNPPTSSDLVKRGCKVDQSKLSPNSRKYTWKEVAEHNSETSCWIYIGHLVYDITAWLNSHPGGKDVLLLCAGRDCTDMFTAYHPFTQRPSEILKQYKIGEITETEFPQYKPDSGFYAECRKRVKEYFRKNNINSKNPIPGLIKVTMMLSIALGCHAFIVLSLESWFIFHVFAAVLFGICQALPLLHAMHDSSHSALGSNPSVWKFVGRVAMDWFAGASIYSWMNQHVIGHHVYTNVLGVDPDLPVKKSGDIRRVSELQDQSWVYRFQHYYLLVLYGLLGLKFRIQDITGTLIDKSNGAIRVNDKPSELYSQIITKLFWAIWRILIPIFYFKVPLTQFFVLFFISEFTTGYYLTFNFQVSHVSPDVLFPSTSTSEFAYEWATSQLLSTVDYAHDNPLMTFLCGALNYQSVHHLFPSVSQYHYPAIAPIVKEVAKKYGVKYNYVGNFGQAFNLHLKHLETMGIQALHMH